jgi:hypothetical protein
MGGRAQRVVATSGEAEQGKSGRGNHESEHDSS